MTETNPHASWRWALSGCGRSSVLARMGVKGAMSDLCDSERGRRWVVGR